MLNFSILICTHNPSEDVFKRLLNAVLDLTVEGFEIEVILVDNNSRISLGEISYIREFLTKCEYSQLIRVEELGLTPARIAGIRKARYDWIVFFDDDNEPSPDYLTTAYNEIPKFNNQFVSWGPSIVRVEYIGNVDNWLFNQKRKFQEYYSSKTQFDNKPIWQDFYPYGTGLIVRKDMAIEYANRVDNKSYTLVDRKGNNLTSGGDVQLVLTCIDCGFFVGRLFGLEINHLIEKRKANLDYLTRLEYGTTAVYRKGFYQVFPKMILPVKVISNKKVFIILIKEIRKFIKNKSKIEFHLSLASKMGKLKSIVEVNNNKTPLFLLLYEKYINV
jgi:glycosyltransferase involved in cell wall biosynthesis